MLEFELRVPEKVSEGATLIVLLHGRGSDRFDLLGLHRGLPSDAIVVTPQAPFSVGPWGYGSGYAWYRFLGEDRPDPDTFAESQERLGDFLAGISTELPVTPGTLTLGGFSQGGTMSLGHALMNPASVPNVLNFSGFLPSHPSVQATPRTVQGTRFFWGHGLRDPAIPFELAVTGRASLRKAGADLEACDYPIGHWIDPAELAAASDWLHSAIARAEKGQG